MNQEDLKYSRKNYIWGVLCNQNNVSEDIYTKLSELEEKWNEIEESTFVNAVELFYKGKTFNCNWEYHFIDEFNTE